MAQTRQVGRTVTVTIPTSVGNDLKKVLKIQEELLGRLGHAQCYSGFDILFRLEGDFVVNPKTNKLQLPSEIGG